MDVSLAAGVTDFELPPMPANRGPSKEDIATMGEMSAKDREAMIESMVEGLAERLGTEGGPPEEWARLLRALSVLGRIDDAIIIYKEAQAVFADYADALAMIENTVEILGIGE